MPKEYLGDSVYVDYDGFQLTLTTENGMGPSNEIVLEPPVYAALELYVHRLRQARHDRAVQADRDETEGH